MTQMPSPTGAERRFSNDKARAAQMTLGTNLSAQNSVKPTRKGAAPVGQPAGNVPQERPQGPQRAPRQFGGPSGRPVPQPKPQGISQPAPEQPSFVNHLIQTIQLDNFLNSGEVQDALAKVKVRDYYNQRDSGPDTGRQVLEILGLD